MSRSAISKSAAPAAVFRPRARVDAPLRARIDIGRRAPPIEEPAIVTPRAAAAPSRISPRAAPITVGQVLRASLLVLVGLGFAQLSQPQRAQADVERAVIATSR